MKSKTGIVYILKAGDVFKIGVTSGSLSNRIKELQTGNPYKIVVYEHSDEIEDYYKLESKLHEMFSHCKLNGEWFRLNNEDIFKAVKVIFEDVVSSYFNGNETTEGKFWNFYNLAKDCGDNIRPSSSFGIALMDYIKKNG